MELKTGDVVYLKSEPNGQRFTIGGVINPSSFYIYWFNHNSKELKKTNINKACLIKV